MKIANETLSKAAEIKAETMGRIFFNVGAHTLSYWHSGTTHFVAWTAKFWDKGLVNSVGQRETFNSESSTLDFIRKKAEYFKANPIEQFPRETNDAFKAPINDPK